MNCTGIYIHEHNKQNKHLIMRVPFWLWQKIKMSEIVIVMLKTTPKTA